MKSPKLKYETLLMCFLFFLLCIVQNLFLWYPFLYKNKRLLIQYLTRESWLAKKTEFLFPKTFYFPSVKKTKIGLYDLNLPHLFHNKNAYIQCWKKIMFHPKRKLTPVKSNWNYLLRELKYLTWFHAVTKFILKIHSQFLII